MYDHERGSCDFRCKGLLCRARKGWSTVDCTVASIVATPFLEIRTLIGKLASDRPASWWQEFVLDAAALFVYTKSKVRKPTKHKSQKHNKKKRKVSGEDPGVWRIPDTLLMSCQTSLSSDDVHSTSQSGGAQAVCSTTLFFFSCLAPATGSLFMVVCEHFLVWAGKQRFFFLSSLLSTW